MEKQQILYKKGTAQVSDKCVYSANIGKRCLFSEGCLITLLKFVMESLGPKICTSLSLPLCVSVSLSLSLSLCPTGHKPVVLGFKTCPGYD